MPNLERLRKLSHDHVIVYDAVKLGSALGCSVSLARTLEIVTEFAGTKEAPNSPANVAKLFGLSPDLSEEQRNIELLNGVERRLSLLVDEAHVKRAPGIVVDDGGVTHRYNDREHATYSAS